MTKKTPERTTDILLLKPTEWPVAVKRAAGEVITVPFLQARKMVIEQSARYAKRDAAPTVTLADLSVAEVLAAAEGYSAEQLHQALELERAGKNRKTLVAGLEQLLAG